MSAFVFGPHILTNMTAPDRPFSAKFRASVIKNGVQREHSGGILRDSSGRLRSDMEFQGVLVGYRVLDPVAGLQIFVNRTNKTFVQSAYGPPPQLGMPHPVAAKRMIEGLECLGYPAGSTIEEAWVSPELEMVIQERTKNESGESAWELYDIIRTEPEETFFQIPSDYQAASGPDA
jgi:hypothetical protein